MVCVYKEATQSRKKKHSKKIPQAKLRLIMLKARCVAVFCELLPFFPDFMTLIRRQQEILTPLQQQSDV